jgi:hypothetical protein
MTSRLSPGTPAFRNPNKEWVLQTLDALIHEWRDWQKEIEKLGVDPHNPLDPRPGNIRADGEENRKRHGLLQARTLAFLEIITGLDGTHADSRDLRLKFRVKHRLDELDELRACLEFAEDTAITSKIDRLTEFRDNLREHDEFSWLNQNARWVRQEVIEARCLTRLTIGPPPAVGGIIMRGVDPFDHMFDAPYGMSIIPIICDMIDKTIGVIRNSPPVKTQGGAPVTTSIQAGYAFVAMPIDPNDDQLVDVLEAIKAAAASCGITAERVDEVESNERITDRI